jgi:hypothetical protein
VQRASVLAVPRQVGQAQRGQREDRPGDRQARPRPCSQVSLTDPSRCSTIPVHKNSAAMVPHESTAPGVVPRGSTLLRYGSPNGTAEPDAGEASRADRESWTLLGSDGKVVEPAERYQAPTAWAAGDSVLSGL